MSQSTRVLKALRAAGPSGVDTTAFLAPSVIDGGKPVLRLAARIRDLRDQGHRITSRRLMNNTVRYFLVESCSSVPASPDVRGGSGPRDRGATEEAGAVALFDESVGRVRLNAALEDVA